MTTRKYELFERTKTGSKKSKRYMNNNSIVGIKNKQKANLQSMQTITKDNVTKIESEMLAQIEKDYEEFSRTHTFKFPVWLYGPPKGKLFQV